MLNTAGALSDRYLASENIHVRVLFRVTVPLRGARVGFYISSPDGFVILEAYDSDMVGMGPERRVGTYVSSTRIPRQLLNEGSYLVNLNAGIPGTRNLCHLQNVLQFHVLNESGTGQYLSERRGGCILPRLE
jgi:lipopolysaccharide transport system ATP-binding protein